ncbi:MAG: hypothetical protein WBA42_21370 [Mesorhizobium sp.]
MSKEILGLGRGQLFESLRFNGHVAGGGAVGPGKVFEYTDYEASSYVYFENDFRSGSKRSGYCVWQLEKDRLYKLVDIAYSSSKSGTYYLSTFGDEPEELSESGFEAERRRVWPLGYERAEEKKAERQRAEAERIERETAEAERRRIEREALAELNAEKAAEIEKNGQAETGLPKLTGTPKQIAYALSIREAFARKHPDDAALKRGTTAKYWIENHRRALYA